MANPETPAEPVDVTQIVTDVIPASVEEASQLWLQVPDIAAAWGLPTDVVHQQYRRARREFRSCLRQVVAYHCPNGGEDLDAECGRLLGFLSD